MPANLYLVFLTDIHEAWACRDWHAHRTAMIVLDLTMKRVV